MPATAKYKPNNVNQPNLDNVSSLNRGTVILIKINAKKMKEIQNAFKPQLNRGQ